VFGVGYFEQDLQAGDVGVRRTVFAPFGDDPVLLADVTLTNTATTTRTLGWFEYWDADPRLVPAKLGGGGPTAPQPIGGVRYHPASRTLLAVPRPGARPRPHAIFLSALDTPVAHYQGSGSRFFGSGDRARPAEVGRGRLSDSGAAAAEPTPMLALQAAVRLAPGQRRTLHYAYGYGDPAAIAPLVRRLGPGRRVPWPAAPPPGGAPCRACGCRRTAGWSARPPGTPTPCAAAPATTTPGAPTWSTRGTPTSTSGASTPPTATRCSTRCR
jgi:glycosyl transferase family 36